MDNEFIRNAIHRLNITPENDSRIELYRQLLQGFLLVAVAQAPGDIAQSGTTLKEDTDLQILTTSTPNGGAAILAFTDAGSLGAHVPNTPYIVMDSRNVLETVVDQGYEALIINAAGPWAGVPREDIVRILDGVWSQGIEVKPSDM